MQGLMQDGQLTVDKILDHARHWHGHREIVTRSVEGPIVRTTYGQIHDRAKRMSNALKDLGITLQVSNVLDSPYRTTSPAANGVQMLEIFEKYGRSWLLGASYHF